MLTIKNEKSIYSFMVEKIISVNLEQIEDRCDLIIKTIDGQTNSIPFKNYRKAVIKYNKILEKLNVYLKFHEIIDIKLKEDGQNSSNMKQT